MGESAEPSPQPLPPEQAAPKSSGSCELIRQFLREVSKYLTYWNLYRLAAENAKTRQQPCDGGILTIEPSEAQLDKMVELHGEHLDWGVKLEMSGRELAARLTSSGHDDAARGVLAIIHRARGGGGGAPNVSKIWEPTKVELQRIALKVEAQCDGDPSFASGSNSGRPATHGIEVVASGATEPKQVEPAPPVSICGDQITIEDFAELSGIAAGTIQNKPAASRPKPTIESRGRQKAVYSYTELRLWALGEFPSCSSRLPEDFKQAIKTLAEIRRNH